MPPTLESEEIARICADVADEKKARDIVILEVRKILIITSYFVIASGDSRKQLQAIANTIHEKLKPQKVKRLGLEGYEEGRWILIDYGDVIVQLFDRDMRTYYDLETIWGDAPKLPWKPSKPQPASAGALAEPPAAAPPKSGRAVKPTLRPKPAAKATKRAAGAAGAAGAASATRRAAKDEEE